VGVAAGEAGLLPTAHAIISRMFSQTRRGTAIAIFSLGLPLGGALGAVIAGGLADSYGWRAVFLMVGPAGLLLLPLMVFAVPRLESGLGPANGSFFADAKQLLKLPFYRNLWAGHAVATLYGYAMGGFFAAFVMRVHGLTTKQAGLLIALSSLTTGVTGVLSGGVMHDWAARRGPGAGLYPAAAALVLSAALTCFGLLSPGVFAPLAMLIIAKLFYASITAPTYATALNLVPANMRATSSALIGLSTSLLGATCGPLVTGVLSDVLEPWAGTDALRYALLSNPGFELLGAFLIWRAARAAASRPELVSVQTVAAASQ
jgi:MFS family permease